MIDPGSVRWSVPESERAGRPLLVVLHGHGLSEDVGAELWHRLPDELVIAAPRGPLRARGGYGWFKVDLSVTAADVDEAANSVLTWLDTQRGFGSVGILGFSQGSAVAIQALRLRPDRFAYGVVLSGFMAPFPAPGDDELAGRRIPVFSARGGRDPLVPNFLAVMTDDWLNDHADLTSRNFADLGHAVSDEELAALREFLETRLRTSTPPNR